MPMKYKTFSGIYTMIRIAKLATNNIGIIDIKTIVTDGAPGIVLA